MQHVFVKQRGFGGNSNNGNEGSFPGRRDFLRATVDYYFVTHLFSCTGISAGTLTRQAGIYGRFQNSTGASRWTVNVRIRPWQKSNRFVARSCRHNLLSNPPVRPLPSPTPSANVEARNNFETYMYNLKASYEDTLKDKIAEKDLEDLKTSVEAGLEVWCTQTVRVWQSFVACPTLCASYRLQVQTNTCAIQRRCTWY